jgi:hypothetical protein
MLQVFYVDVAYVLVAIHICCKWLFKMFHLFQTYVAGVLFECCICCSGYTHMLQAYVINVSPVSHVCCRSTSCCNISGPRSGRMRRQSTRVRKKRSRRGWSPLAYATAGRGVQQHAGQLGQAQQHAEQAQQAWVSPRARGKRSSRGWSAPAYTAACVCAAVCGAVGAGAAACRTDTAGGSVRIGASVRTLLLDLRNRNWKLCNRDKYQENKL